MLSNKVALGAAWLFFGKMLSHIVALLGTLVVARLLTPEAFGLIALAMSIMAIVAALTELPVSMALIQLKDATKQDYDTAFTLSVMRGSIVAVLICVAAWPAAMIYNDERLGPLVLTFALYPLIAGFGNSNFERRAREMKFNYEFSMMLAAKLASFIATVAFAYYTRSYWAIAIGQLALVGVQTLMTYILCPILPGISLKSWKRLFNYSIWLGIGWFVNQVNWRSDMLLIGGVLGQKTLGHYTVGTQLTNESTQMVIQAVQKSLFAAFSQIQDEKARMRRGYLNAQIVTFALVMPMAFGLAATADWALPLLFGEKWRDAVIVVQLSAPIAAFMTMTAPSRALALATGRTRLTFFVDLLALAVRLPLIIIGVMQFGLVGVLVGRALAGAFMLFVNMAMVRHLIGLGVIAQLVNITRPLFAGGVMLAAVFGMRQVVHFQGSFLERLAELGLVAGVGAAVYISVSLTTWVMAGRPEGLETRLGGAFGKLRAKLSGGEAAA